MRRFRGLCLTLLLVTMALILGGVILGVVWLWSSIGGGPELTILQPSNGIVLESGQGILLVAKGHSKRPLQRLELTLDGEKIMQPQAAFDPDRQTFRLVIPWFSSQLGYHTLGLVAYDDLSRPSQPAQVTVYIQPYRQASYLSGEAPPSGQSDELPPATQPSGGEDQPTPQSPSGSAAPPAGDGSSSQGGQGDAHGNPDAPGGVGSPQGNQDDQAPPDVDFMIEGGLNPGEDIFPIGDNPPQIASFETPFTRQGGGISVNSLAQAVDDVAMGDVAILMQQVDNSAGFAMERHACPGELECAVQLSTSLSAGSWVFAAQAYDTVGQASEISLRVFQVIPDAGGQEPAVVVGGLELLELSEADVALALGNAPLDLQSLASFLMQLNRQEAISSSGDEGCLALSGQSLPEGVSIRLQVNCPYYAALDKHIFIKATRTVGGDIRLHLRPWEDSIWNPSPRTDLAAGEVLENIDTDAKDCGLEFDYTFQVGYALYDTFRNEYNLTGFRALGDPAHISIPTPACTSDFHGLDGAISLNASPIDQGVQINWNIADNSEWVDQLPARPEKVNVLVARYLPSRPGFTLLPGTRQVYADELPGQSNQILDDVLRNFCGEPLKYILFVQHGNPNDGGRVYAQKSVSLEPVPCPATSLRNLDLTITPEWKRTASGHQLFAKVSMSLERDFAWPETGTRLVFNVWRQGEDDMFRFADIDITWDIHRWGYTFIESIGTEAHIQCGGILHNFSLASYSSDGALIDRGRVVPWISPPCPLPPPRLTSLHATNAGGAQGAIVLNWELPAFPDDFEPDQSYIEIRRISDLPGDWQTLQAGVDQTQFVDTGVAGGRLYLYIVDSCVQASPAPVCGPNFGFMNIRTPQSAGNSWDVWSTDYDANR